MSLDPLVKAMEKVARQHAMDDAIAAERERCAKIAEARAVIFRSGAAGLCTTVLEKECERIAAAIRQQ